MGLVVQRICVWCLVIVAIFTGFGQARAKRCGGCLKVINWGWRCKSQKRGSFHREGRFSLCNTAVLWNFIASLTGYILYKILLDTSFHYTTIVLRVWGWQNLKCNSKCPNDINTEWAIPEKFSSFLLYSWKFHNLNPSLSPLPLVWFFHYSVCTVISDSNHPFDTSTYTHTVSQEYIILLQLKIHIWMEFFWNQKFIFFHKRNFNPKVINYFK